MNEPQTCLVETPALTISCRCSGPEDGAPVVLMHGFPYSARAYDEVARILAAEGFRAIAPDLRGYGETRFRRADTPRSGEQAALGQDLIDLIEALALRKPIVVGYDWGGRAACITAAMRPDLVSGLVTIGGYNIFPPMMAGMTADPAMAHRGWYMYLLHSDAGSKVFAENYRAFCKYIWNKWSPLWQFTDDTFNISAMSFDNSDFATIVIQSYRHRMGLAPGDPAVAALEAQLLQRPPIATPTVVLHGDADGVQPASMSEDLQRFTGFCRRFVVPRAGHNLPQEAPGAVADAVRILANLASPPG